MCRVLSEPFLSVRAFFSKRSSRLTRTAVRPQTGPAYFTQNERRRGGGPLHRLVLERAELAFPIACISPPPEQGIHAFLSFGRSYRWTITLPQLVQPHGRSSRMQFGSEHWRRNRNARGPSRTSKIEVEKGDDLIIKG